MEWAAAIQKAINYMEDHLLENLTCEDVARQVHTSAYELHRAFSFLTGMTANAYIRSRRLSLLLTSRITGLSFSPFSLRI